MDGRLLLECDSRSPDTLRAMETPWRHNKLNNTLGGSSTQLEFSENSAHSSQSSLGPRPPVGVR